MIDCHIHTKLCRHAEGEMHEYIQQAIAVGLTGVGFCDHMPPTRPGEDWGWTMATEEFPIYVHDVLQLRDQFPQLKILLSVEVDHFPERVEEITTCLKQYPFDYINGSIHFIDGWNFDGTDAYKEWDIVDVDAKYERYYGLLQDAARSGLYNIMAHTDLVKKYGHRATQDMTSLWRQTAQVFHETGVAVEINASGLRKPAKEIYPSRELLKIYYEEKVPIVFSSDAHKPAEVGMYFAEAKELARSVGYREAVMFEKGSVIGTYGF